MLALSVLYIALLVVTVIIGVALAAYAWRHRRTPGAVAFAGGMLTMALWSLALAVMAFTNSPEAADFWGRQVRYIALTIGPVLVLIFVLQYTGRREWLSWARLALLFIIPAITLMLTWSGDAHHLYLDVVTAKVGSFTFLGESTIRGPWSVVHTTYSFLLAIISPVLLLIHVFRSKGPYRGQAILRAHDTLEQRVAERTAELALEKQVADHIINSLPGMFYVYDDQSRLIRWNDRHRQVTGYTDEELLHKSVLEFFAKEDQELIARRLEQLYDEGAAHAEAPILTKAGEQIPMFFTGVLTTLGEQPVFVGLGIEITDRKKMETELDVYRHNLEELVAQRTAELQQARDAAEAANRAKSAFLANMSHELRTPLNAILGLAQVLAHDPDLAASQKESLDIIGRSGEHLLDLVNDVLEISRIEAGRTSLDLAGFDLYRTLSRLEEMVGVQAERQGLALLFERTENLPRYVRSDERKLRQVLLNLLANAVKFTPVGCVSLRISSQEMTPDSVLPSARHLLRFEVQDTGVGIAPAETEALFEPFVQGESGQKGRGGTGLGLTISREYVELMGGEISVSSPPPVPLTSAVGVQGGPGTLFTVTLPVELVDAFGPDSLLPTRRAIVLAPSWPDAAPPRILVVDDSQENRVVLREILQRAGFAVKEAAGGEDAINLHTSWQPDLIWMDIRMPDLDGYEATRRIRQGVNSKLATVPIIAVTASAFEEDHAAVLAAGSNDFVRKPFRESEVLEVTARHLGIEYLYQQLPIDLEGEGDRELFVALTPDNLNDLPDAWVNDLSQAARRGRAGQVLALIEGIERERPQIARGLQALVRESRFLDIVTAAEGSRDGR